MNKFIKEKLFMLLGCVFVALGAIGAILPLMPTTVFLIIALAFFSKSSPRFHQKLLENRWFGEDLRRWQEHRAMAKSSKVKATWAIVITFSLSILLLYSRIYLQILLLAIALVLLAFIWHLKE